MHHFKAGRSLRTLDKAEILLKTLFRENARLKACGGTRKNSARTSNQISFDIPVPNQHWFAIHCILDQKSATL